MGGSVKLLNLGTRRKKQASGELEKGQASEQQPSSLSASVLSVTLVLLCLLFVPGPSSFIPPDSLYSVIHAFLAQFSK